MRELSAAEVAEVTTLYELCSSGVRTECADAQVRLGAWLEVKLGQAINRDEICYEIAGLLAVEPDRIDEWVALASAPKAPFRLSSSLEDVLRRRRLPDLYEDTRRSPSGTLIKETVEIAEPQRIIIADTTGRVASRGQSAEFRKGSLVVSTRATVLVVTGSDRNGNRFGSEISMIRRLTDFARKSCIERNCVSADEIGHQLRENPATIIHLAFHAAYGAAEFEGPEGDSDPAQVRFDDLVATLKQEAPPGLLVLAGCDSIRVASGLGDWAATTVAWPSKTDDHEIRRYCHGLYLSLFRGEGMERAHGAGMNNISVVDEDLRPQCLGNKNWALAHGPP